jgi:prohibitin 1
MSVTMIDGKRIISNNI